MARVSAPRARTFATTKNQQPCNSTGFFHELQEAQ